MLLLSIIPNHASLETVLIQTVLSFLMIAIVWNVKNKPHYLSQRNVNIALVLCLLYYLFPMSGSDYWGYKEMVETAGVTDLDLISQYTYHMEKPYWWITNMVNNNYFLFRLVVWGGSLFFFWLTAKQLGIDKSIFVFYLCVFIVQMTAVSRVSLAIAMSSFGASLIISPYNKGRFIKVLLGASVIGLSMFFHRSAVFLLLVFPLSIIRWNKRIIWAFVIAFPLLVMMANLNLIDFISGDFSEDALIDSSTAEYYLNYNKRVFGIGRIIYLALQYLCMIITIVVLYKAINKGDYKKWPKYVQFFCNAYLFTALFSAVFLFSLDGSTEKIFERLIAFSYFPQAVCLSYFLMTNYKPKTISIINYLIIGYFLYSTLYFTLYLG